MGLTLVTPPTELPITVDDAKQHLRVEADVTVDDGYITRSIDAARKRYEHYSKRALITQTWDWTLDAFPRLGWLFEVPKPRLQSVASIQYIDTAGATQTLATSEYTVDAKNQPGRIAEAFGKSWPATQAVINAVTVQFIAGHATSAEVPEDVKFGMLLVIGHLYQNRESVIVGTIATKLPDGVEALWAPYRVTRF